MISKSFGLLTLLSLSSIVTPSVSVSATGTGIVPQQLVYPTTFVEEREAVTTTYAPFLSTTSNPIFPPQFIIAQQQEQDIETTTLYNPEQVAEQILEQVVEEEQEAAEANEAMLAIPVEEVMIDEVDGLRQELFVLRNWLRSIRMNNPQNGDNYDVDRNTGNSYAVTPRSHHHRHHSHHSHPRHESWGAIDSVDNAEKSKSPPSVRGFIRKFGKLLFYPFRKRHHHSPQPDPSPPSAPTDPSQPPQ